MPVLRTPKPDDFIVVSSDGGTKKLSRFFTHSKIDREQRAVFPVVADGNEIIWVVGLRLSERYKVTGSTKRVMKITYKRINKEVEFWKKEQEEAQEILFLRTHWWESSLWGHGHFCPVL